MGSSFPSCFCPAPCAEVTLGQISRAQFCSDQDLYPHQAAPTLDQAPTAQSSQTARAEPTAQTCRAPSSLPPVTSPRSVGQSWALPSSQILPWSPSATQGHPKGYDPRWTQALTRSPINRPKQWLPKSPLLLLPLPLFQRAPHPIPSSSQLFKQY